MITLIGGSGFIGSRLAKRLEKSGKMFAIIDKSPPSIFGELTHTADVCNLDSLIRSCPDSSVIINLAAEHRDNVTPLSRYFEVNVKGAENVCDMARHHGTQKIIFISSAAVYGFAAPNATEKDDCNPFNEYGRTKLEAEQVYIRWQNESPEERSLAIVRPTVVFGEQNRGNVYSLLKQVTAGMFLMIGDGKNKKSMAYVENVAAFLEYCLTGESGVHIYNYVDKPDLNMNELVGIIRKRIGKSPEVHYRLPYWLGCVVGVCFDIIGKITKTSPAISLVRIKKFCSTTQFSSETIGMTDFEPEVTIQEALKRTIDFELSMDGDSE